MKKLGIIGGLGPMASAHFLTLITKMSEAEKDQDHIEIILYSSPGIPDRSAFITGKSAQSPEPDLLEIAKKLTQAGAEVLAIPCFSAHYFLDSIRKTTNIPVIDAIAEVASHLQDLKIKKAGILATDGLLHCGLYQTKLTQAGIKPLLPEADTQKKVVDLIYRIKSGCDIDFEEIHLLSQPLFANGAEVVLLGCSDLSIIKRGQPSQPKYVDVLEILARRAVIECGVLRQEYINFNSIVR